jgi:hypothetical protein
MHPAHPASVRRPLWLALEVTEQKSDGSRFERRLALEKR